MIARVSESEPIRRELFFSGRVQGVGFRYTAQMVSRDYAVSGYVRNLADGRVELVAEGPRDEVDRFQRAVEGAMKGNIENTATTDRSPSGLSGGIQISH